MTNIDNETYKKIDETIEQKLNDGLWEKSRKRWRIAKEAMEYAVWVILIVCGLLFFIFLFHSMRDNSINEDNQKTLQSVERTKQVVACTKAATDDLAVLKCME